MAKPKAVLIVGASGFVGTHLAQMLRVGYKVYGTFWKNYVKIPGVTMLPMDALQREWVKKIVYTIEPDVVIYSGGKSDLEWSERNPKEADRDHSAAPVNVLTAAEILKPKFICLSNSYVFDGNSGNYHETDNTMPELNMGKCKLRGENFIRGKSLNYLIIRSAPVFGRGNGKHFSLLDRLRILLSQGKTVELSTQEFRSFAPVEGLGEVLMKVIDSGIKGRVLHYGGLTKLNLNEFGKLFAQAMGFDPRLVISPKIPAKAQMNEYDFTLNCTDATKLLKVKPLSIEESFSRLKR